MGRFYDRFLCLIGDHEYTSKTEQGIKPNPEKMKRNPVGYFFEFTRMYCLRCGHVWKG